MHTALLIASVVLAYLVKGLCGFGNTLVFSTMLGFAMDNAAISPLDLLVGAPSNLMQAWRYRRSIRWRACLPLAGLVLAGSLPGALLLRVGDARLIKVIFGLVVTGIAAEMFLRDRRGGAAKANPVVMAGLGLLSGVLCGLFGVGALLAAYVSRTTNDPDTFKANLGVVFSVESLFRLGMYIYLGLFTAETLRLSALLLPLMALSLLGGMALSSRLNARAARLAVVAVLMLSGLSLVIRNLL